MGVGSAIFIMFIGSVGSVPKFVRCHRQIFLMGILMFVAYIKFQAILTSLEFGEPTVTVCCSLQLFFCSP